jgi:molybdopterin-guanine dinucleotide biosynthesis protein A
MPCTDLYIIAAGNGSRLNATLPKALVPIRDEPCITTTLRQIAPKFDKVFVVTNVLTRLEWERYFRHLQTVYPSIASRTYNLSIQSGLGDGHATLHGLLAAERTCEHAVADDVVIAWGDAFFQHAQIIDELLAQPLRGSGLFPVVHERSPYVSLLVDEQMRCAGVDFSKYGETHAQGLHDQSVFRFVRTRLKASLQELHNGLWKINRYVTPGGELSLLYTVHHLYNTGHPVRAYETRYPTLSFNTVEEILAIQQKIAMELDAVAEYASGA